MLFCSVANLPCKMIWLLPKPDRVTRCWTYAISCCLLDVAAHKIADVQCVSHRCWKASCLLLVVCNLLKLCLLLLVLRTISQQGLTYSELSAAAQAG